MAQVAELVGEEARDYGHGQSEHCLPQLLALEQDEYRVSRVRREAPDTDPAAPAPGGCGRLLRRAHWVGALGIARWWDVNYNGEFVRHRRARQPCRRPIAGSEEAPKE